MVAGQRPKKMGLRGSLLLDTSTMTTVNWVEGGCYGMGVRWDPRVVKNLPVLGVGEENYKTEEACLNANAGTKDTFWCVTRNWLIYRSTKTRACFRDRLNIVKWYVASADCYARRDVGGAR